MFSVYGDTVVDPFVGTGTTILASMIAGRNSIGIEIENHMVSDFHQVIQESLPLYKKLPQQRLQAHTQFIEERSKTKQTKHINKKYLFPVVTQQEKEIEIVQLQDVSQVNTRHWKATYTSPNFQK